MTALVDTNIVIDFLRRRPSAHDFFQTLVGKPALSVISVMELMHGARTRNEEARIDRIVDSATVLPVTIKIAEAAGRMTKHYQRSHGLEFPDALIAATAEQHGLKLATLNVKHFPMFPRLKPPY